MYFTSLLFFFLALARTAIGIYFDSGLNWDNIRWNTPFTVAWYYEKEVDTHLIFAFEVELSIGNKGWSYYTWIPNKVALAQGLKSDPETKYRLYAYNKYDSDSALATSPYFKIQDEVAPISVDSRPTTTVTTTLPVPSSRVTITRTTQPPLTNTSEGKQITSTSLVDQPPSVPWTSTTSQSSISISNESTSTIQDPLSTDLDPSPTSSIPTSQITNSKSSITLPTKTIAAIASGTGALLLFSVSLTAFLLIRKRRRERENKRKWERGGADTATQNFGAFTDNNGTETKSFSGGKQELDSTPVPFPRSEVDQKTTKHEGVQNSRPFVLTETKAELDNHPLVSPISPITTSQELPTNPMSITPITPRNSTPTPAQMMFHSMLHSRSLSQDLNRAKEHPEISSATNTILSAPGRKDLENASATTNTTNQQIPDTLKIGQPIAEDGRRSTQEIAELY